MRLRGFVEPNLVWKDTVLVHCHIAEHHEAGMMLSFVVDEAA